MDYIATTQHHTHSAALNSYFTKMPLNCIYASHIQITETNKEMYTDTYSMNNINFVSLIQAYVPTHSDLPISGT